mgnify:CR=1 FL=1
MNKTFFAKLKGFNSSFDKKKVVRYLAETSRLKDKML